MSFYDDLNQGGLEPKVAKVNDHGLLPLFTYSCLNYESNIRILWIFENLGKIKDTHKSSYYFVYIF